MPETGTKKEPILLHETHDADRHVVIHPQNNDLFVRTARQVIDSCRLGISVDLWLTELNSMLEQVRKWASAHAAQVAACWCAAAGTKTVLFFIPASPRFDFDLADEMTKLNGRLVSEFNVGMIEVRQIPAEEIERFVDLQSARLVYDGPAALDPESHQAVEA